RTNVRAVVLHHFGYRFGRGIEAKEGYRTVAVGENVDLIVGPDRIEIIRTFARDLHHVERRHVGNPDGAGQSAAVVSPGNIGEVIERRSAAHGRVSEVFSVRRKLAGEGHGKRQGSG